MSKTQTYLLRGIALFLLLLLFSCHKIFFSGGEKQNMKPSKLFEKVQEHQIQYKSFLLKADGEFTWNDNKQSFQLHARIQHDSVIWVSLRMMGIEGMRLLITPDSVFMVDRINNSWYASNFEELNNNLDLDITFDILQSVLTNSFFFYPPTNDTAKTIHDFNTCKDSANYCISTISERKYRKLSDTTNNRRVERRLNREQQESNEAEQKPDYIMQTVRVYPEIFKPSYVYLGNMLKRQSLEILYNKPVLYTNEYFPSEIGVDCDAPGFKFSLVLRTERIEINTEQKYPFKIPENYNRMK